MDARGGSQASGGVVEEVLGAAQEGQGIGHGPHMRPGAGGELGEGVREPLRHLEVAVKGIAEEDVITAVAGEQHGDFGFDGRRDFEHGQSRGAGERLGVGGGEFVERGRLVRRERNHLVRDAEQTCGVARIAGFIARIIGRADRVGLQVGVQAAHGPADQAGIDATAQEHAGGHVGEQAQADGLDEQALGFLDSVLEADARIGIDARQRPVSATGERAIAPFDDGRGGNFFDAVEDGALIGDVAEFEVFEHGRGIDFSGEARGLERAHSGGESDLSVASGVDQRLHAQAVAD